MSTPSSFGGGTFSPLPGGKATPEPLSVDGNCGDRGSGNRPSPFRWTWPSTSADTSVNSTNTAVEHRNGECENIANFFLNFFPNPVWFSCKTAILIVQNTIIYCRLQYRVPKTKQTKQNQKPTPAVRAIRVSKKIVSYHVNTTAVWFFSTIISAYNYNGAMTRN